MSNPKTTATLSLTLGSTGFGTEGFWFRLEQVKPKDDLATVADAAELIDKIFGIEPCDQGTGTGGEPIETAPDTGDPVPPVEKDEFMELVGETVEIDACVDNPDFDWTAEVDVVRSHPTIPYTLQCPTATILATKKITETRKVTLLFDGAASMDLPYPVMGQVSGYWSSWSGASAPGWTISGGTLYLEAATSGQLNLSYPTEYDRVSVRIPGKDEERQSAEVIGFWRRSAEMITLEPPEIDETAVNDPVLCARNTRGNVEEGDREPTTCFEYVEQVTRCQCSGREVSTETIEQKLDCPPGAPAGSHLFGTRSVTKEYIDCGETSSEHIANSMYKVAMPSYYEEVCCFPPNHALPQCPVMHRVWQPGASIKPSKEYYEDLYGENIRFVPVIPREGNCGEVEIRQEITGNCCDVAPELEWDYTRSFNVAAPSTNATVYLIGGMGPYHVEVSGIGFWLDGGHSAKTGRFQYKAVDIHLASNACGSCLVTITDQCGNVVAEYVRSSAGSWYQVVASWNSTIVSGGGCSYGGTTNWCSKESTKGKYRVLRWDLELQTTTSGWVAPVVPVYADQYIRDICTESWRGYPLCQIVGPTSPGIGHDPGPACQQQGAGIGPVVYLMQFCCAWLNYPGKTWDVWEWIC
jgi:hypothetical protein